MAVGTYLIARLMQMMGSFLAKPKKGLEFSEIQKKTLDTKVLTSMGEVNVTVYSSPDSTRNSKPPVYVNFHGGGFIMRNPESDDHICRYVADKANCFVVNVDYDVAPQKPFPVAPVQSYDVVQWVINNGDVYGWDSSRLAVGGQSAGGNLAAGVCISSLEKNTQLPELQILLYPPLDLATPPENKSSSIDKPLINPKVANVFDSAYLPDVNDRKNPLASPLLAKDFSKFPEALVITAEYDLLRQEGDDYSAALSKAGVKVSHHVIKGVDHAFTHAGPVKEAKEAIHLIAEAIQQKFNPD